MSKVTAIQILEKAKEVLVDHEWTTRALCRDSHGTDVPINSDDGHAFCAEGALKYAAWHLGQFQIAPSGVYFGTLGAAYLSAIRTLNDAIDESSCANWSISGWNDATGRTKKEVVVSYDQALVKAKGNEVAQ